MAMLHSPGEVVTFTPAGQDAIVEGKRVRYHLRVPSFAEKTKLKRAITMAGGRRHAPAAVVAVCRQAVEGVYEGAPPAHLIAILDEVEAAGRAAAEAYIALPEANGPEVRERFLDAAVRFQAANVHFSAMVEEVSPYSTTLAGMLGDNAVYLDIVGREGARLLLMGWDNVKGEFSRSPHGVPDPVLDRIPNAHWPLLGAEVERLYGLTEEEVGKSASPSPGPCDGETSTGTSTPT